MSLDIDELVLNVVSSYTYRKGEVVDVSYSIRDLDSDSIACQDIIDPTTQEPSFEMAALLANVVQMYAALRRIADIYEYENNLPYQDRSLRMWKLAKASVKLITEQDGVDVPTV